MIKYFVRTIPEREFKYDLDYEVLVDYDHNPNQSFIDQLEIISEYDAVLLEDDLMLCKDFKNEIEKVIAEHPNEIINFYTYHYEWFTSHTTFKFSSNQCTYYPKGVAKIVAKEMRKVLKVFVTNPPGYDMIECTALRNLNIPHFAYRPCLVQHVGYYSYIDKRSFPKDTLFFKDYLDELGIPYSEAYKRENILKLERFKGQ